MSYQEIPLTSDPNQGFDITLTIDGENKTLSFFVSFNEVAQYWTMMISNTETGEVLVSSIPLIIGLAPDANLLSQFAFLRIGSAYLLNVSNVSTKTPDSKNMGSDFVLIWGDTPNA